MTSGWPRQCSSAGPRSSSGAQQDPDQHRSEAELPDPEGCSKVDRAEKLGEEDPAGKGEQQKRVTGAHGASDPSLGGAASVVRCSPTTTFTCALIREGTPAHRYFTAANVERYLAAASEAGVDEVGVSEHVYRFTEALDHLAPPVLGEQRQR